MPTPQRWQTTLWIMFAAQLISALGFAIIFPFLPLYVAELGTQTGLSIEFWAGVVFSGQALAMAISSPIWGELSDRFGHKLMLERAMYSGSILLLLMAFVRSAEELALIRAVQGMFTGTLSAANALVATEAPRDRLGYAMGTLQMGLWTGIALGPLVGGVLADAFGYRVPFILTAVLLLLAGMLVTFGVRRDERPASGSGRPRQSMLSSWRTIMTTPSMPLTYSLRFLGSLANTMLLPFAPLFITTLMHSSDHIATFTGLIVGSASAASLTTAIFFGRLGDRKGHRKVLIGCTTVGALLYLIHPLVESPWQLLLLQLLAGAAWGGVTPSISALLSHYTSGGSEGAIYGIDNAIMAGARSLAPIVGAAVVLLLDLRGIFLAIALLYSMIALLSLLRLPVQQQSRSS